DGHAQDHGRHRSDVSGPHRSLGVHQRAGAAAAPPGSAPVPAQPEHQHGLGCERHEPGLHRVTAVGDPAGQEVLMIAVEQIMGMPIVVESSDASEEAVARVFDWFRWVDETFSTYKDE